MFETKIFGTTKFGEALLPNAPLGYGPERISTFFAAKTNVYDVHH